MDVSTFKAIIEANGGEDKVIAITFDNSAAETFVRFEHPYSHAEYLDEANSCLKLKSRDIQNREFLVVKPLETIQSINFALSPWNRMAYDGQSIRT